MVLRISPDTPEREMRARTLAGARNGAKVAISAKKIKIDSISVTAKRKVKMILLCE